MAKAPDSNPKNLLSLISDVYNGKVVVPEFQRSFVWQKSNIEEFLTSLLHGYFIGTFLMLDTSSKKAMFPFRSVEGVKNINTQVRPKDQGMVQLVLDGQQRITSLFYAFYEPDIPLKGVKNAYRFYLNLDEALHGDLDEAVTGISKKDRRQILEFDKLCEQSKAIPFSMLGNSRTFYEWLYQKQSTWQGEDLTCILELYRHLEQFMVPVIALPSETSKDDIVNIFERINRTGISLSLFDLAVAQLYQKQINLRDLWEDFTKQHKEAKSAIQPVFLLRVITLLEGKEIRKRDLLDAIDLEEDKFNHRWNESVECIVQAHRRITQHYGAFDERWIPYTSLFVTLAVFLHKLKEKFAGAHDYRKVDQWYWGCVLSGRYDKNIFTRTYEDIRDIEKWIKEENNLPQWLQQFTNHDLNFDSVDDPRSSLYRGIINLIVCQGAKDFLTGQPAKLSECQDDHIFPKSRYKEDQTNSILNRTLIWEKTNLVKRNKQPSEFFSECLRKHGDDETKLIETLGTHFISPDAYVAIKQDNFDGFLAERRKTFNTIVQELFK